MKKNTLYLIIAIAVIVLVVGVLSSNGNIDVGSSDSVGSDGAVTTTAQPAATTTAAACKHTEHTTSGYCTKCVTFVGHNYNIRGDILGQGADETHVVQYICDCGNTRSTTETCVLVNDVCVYCGADYGCTHYEHDENGICTSCETNVGHDYSLTYYSSNDDGTHIVQYGCLPDGRHGGSNIIECTFVDGVCSDCGYEQPTE